MRFTRRTYRKAIRRSIDRELCFHSRRMTRDWIDQKNHTDRVRARRIRERGK